MAKLSTPENLEKWFHTISEQHISYSRDLRWLYKNLIAEFFRKESSSATSYPNSLNKTPDSYNRLKISIAEWFDASSIKKEMEYLKMDEYIKSEYLRDLYTKNKSDAKSKDKMIVIFRYFEHKFQSKKRNCQYWLGKLNERSRLKKNLSSDEDFLIEDVQSFYKVTRPKPSANADKFYNGFPARFEDLSADFDFERQKYVAKNGIRDEIENYFNGVGTCFWILIKGVAGSGKSTLSKRIGLDLTLRGRNVYIIKKGWLQEHRRDSLQTQIKNLAESVDELVVIIDDVVECVNQNQLNLTALSEELQSKKVLFILTAQPDKINNIKREISNLESYHFSQFNLHTLDLKDCEDFVDKMIALEEKGLLSIKHGNLNRNERLDICHKYSNREFVVVMLQLRYGRRFKDIILNEYEQISSPLGKEAYLMTCFCHRLRIPLPETILYNALKIETSENFDAIRNSTEDLLIEEPQGFYSRHIIIAREIFYGFIHRKQGVLLILKNLFTRNQNEGATLKFFLEAFLKIDFLHSRLFNDLERDESSLRKIIELIENVKGCFDKELFKRFLSFKGNTERILGNNEQAKAEFNKILNDLDHKNLYSYRQIAWIEHDMGNYLEAANIAIESFAYAKDDYHHLFNIARILSLNTIENYYKAERYYIEGLNICDEPRFREEYEKYLESKKILEYFASLNDDEFVPDSVIKLLRPNLRFLRSFFGINSRDYKFKLLSVLQSMEGEIKGNIDELETLIEGYDITKDRLVQSKYYSNLGRLLYLESTKGNQNIDRGSIADAFERSIQLNPTDPFTYCWQGTYFKEVEKNNLMAETKYRKAIEISEASKNEFDIHPLFTNNLALLIIDEVLNERMPKEKLKDAEELLLSAVTINNAKNKSFYWAEYNLDKCKQTISRLCS